MRAHSEICDVSLFTTGIRNAGRVGYDVALDSRTERCDWKVDVDIWSRGVGEEEEESCQRRGGRICWGVILNKACLYMHQESGK